MEEFAQMAIESAKKANAALVGPQQRTARDRARKRSDSRKEDSANPTPQMLSIMKKKQKTEGNLEVEEFAQMAIESARKANAALGEPRQRMAPDRARKSPEAGKEDSANPTPQMLSIMKKKQKPEGNLDVEEFAQMAIESAKKANVALGGPQQRAARERVRKRPDAEKEDTANPTPQMLSIMKKRKK